MATVRDAVDPQAVQAIDRILRQAMGRFGCREAIVRADVDHDGDRVPRIEAQYDLVSESVDPEATIDLTSDLRDALEAPGEFRFPHVRHNFHDDRTVVELKRRKRW